MSAMLGAIGAASKFDPVQLDWEALYYPGGAAFQSQGYTNNQVLNDGEPIPDESSGSNDLLAPGAAETTLTYVASSNVNSRPAVRGASLSSGDQPGYRNTLSSGLTSYSVVAVWYQDTILDNFSAIVHDVVDDGVFKLMIAQDGRVGISANTGTSTYTAAGLVSAGNTYGFRINFVPTQATAHLDGSEIFDSVAAMGTFNGAEMFNQEFTAWPFSGDLAFCGVYDGDVTSHARWAMFKNWADAEFGCTL